MIDGQLTFIRCVPDLPPNVWLDDRNNIHVTTRAYVETALSAGYISVEIEKKRFEIRCSELKIIRKQNYTFHGAGIPINGCEPKEPVPLSDLVVHIELE